MLQREGFEGENGRLHHTKFHFNEKKIKALMQF